MVRPRIIVTGASGFVGRHLLDEIKECFHVFAFARRSQAQCGAPVHPNIDWTQVDIAESEPLTAAFAWIRDQGPVESLVHLAAHYDFTGRNNPEYQRTNIDGLKNTLELSRTLDLRRFIFASSVAACAFPGAGRSVHEATPPDANHPYARSKRVGEEMVRAYSSQFPTCIARFAALYSDWCEYPPLFNFLSNWLSKGWNARMIGGRGDFGIPFMHVRCAVSFLNNLLHQIDVPGSGEILIASPDGAVTVRELFDAATVAYFGDRRKPMYIPKLMTTVWLHVQDTGGKAIGRRPFERPWMARFLDQKLTVDASRTRVRLNWTTRPRFEIIRRIPFLVENLRTQPLRWDEVNHAAMRKEESGYGLKIQWLLEKHQEEICRRQVEALLSDATDDTFGTYRRFERRELALKVSGAVRNLRRTIRTREMEPIGGHCRSVARDRFHEGFNVEEVGAAFSSLGKIAIEVLEEDGPPPGLKQAMVERITMAIQFGIDEVLDEYEILTIDGRNPCPRHR